MKIKRMALYTVSSMDFFLGREVQKELCYYQKPWESNLKSHWSLLIYLYRKLKIKNIYEQNIQSNKLTYKHKTK